MVPADLVANARILRDRLDIERGQVRLVRLLRVLNVHEPASIRETARLVERDKKNVHDQLRKLAAYGVVEFVKEGNAKRPVVAYDEIVFDFAVSLDPSEEDSTDESVVA